MTPEGIFMSITGLAPRPIEETPKDFRFLSIRASHFRIGVGELRRGRRPDLARDPHTECADGQDRHNVVYTVEFSCASTDANCDDAVLTVDVPRFANPDGAVNSEVAPVLAAATNTTGFAPPTPPLWTRPESTRAFPPSGTSTPTTSSSTTSFPTSATAEWGRLPRTPEAHSGSRGWPVPLPWPTPTFRGTR